MRTPQAIDARPPDAAAGPANAQTKPPSTAGTAGLTAEAPPLVVTAGLAAASATAPIAAASARPDSLEAAQVGAIVAAAAAPLPLAEAAPAKTTAPPPLAEAGPAKTIAPPPLAEAGPAKAKGAPTRAAPPATATGQMNTTFFEAVTGTPMADDRDAIFVATGVSASVRQRMAWDSRYLQLEGAPPAGVEEASHRHQLFRHLRLC